MGFEQSVESTCQPKMNCFSRSLSLRPIRLRAGDNPFVWAGRTPSLTIIKSRFIAADAGELQDLTIMSRSTEALLDGLDTCAAGHHKGLWVDGVDAQWCACSEWEGPVCWVCVRVGMC